jgi:hypothetical protein
VARNFRRRSNDNSKKQKGLLLFGWRFLIGLTDVEDENEWTANGAHLFGGGERGVGRQAERGALRQHEVEADVGGGAAAREARHDEQLHVLQQRAARRVEMGGRRGAAGIAQQQLEPLRPLQARRVHVVAALLAAAARRCRRRCRRRRCRVARLFARRRSIGGRASSRRFARRRFALRRRRRRSAARLRTAASARRSSAARIVVAVVAIVVAAVVVVVIVVVIVVVVVKRGAVRSLHLSQRLHASINVI